MKVSLPFRDAEGKSDSGGLLWNSGEQGALVLSLALPVERRAHNCYYEPCPFYPRKAMLQRFILVNFSRTCYQGSQRERYFW